MNPSVLRLEKMREEFSTIYLEMLEAGCAGRTVLSEIQFWLKEVGIDSFIYESMRRDVCQGNFSVIYLDDRIVGEDKKRLKAKKRLDEIRAACQKMLYEGKTITEILIIGR